MFGILKGLATTFSTFTRKPVTIEYPDEKRNLPERQRSFPVLTWDFDHDEPFCTGCNICVRNCPVDCMTAVMQDNPKHPEGTSNRRKIAGKFWIDYARCMRCNICVEVCPFEAIVMDNNWSGHEHSVFDRRDLHKDIEDLLASSKSGELSRPFRPLDSINLSEAVSTGEETPEATFVAALPKAREEQNQRIEQGLGAAIQEREPEVQATTSASNESGVAEDDFSGLSERKLRARRMKAEREAKVLLEKNEVVGQELLYVLGRTKSTLYKEITGEDAPSIPVPPSAKADSPSPISPNSDAGDPNSPRKIRAKRMRAERTAREHIEKNEEVPAVLMTILRDTESPIYTELGGTETPQVLETGTSNPDIATENAEGNVDSPRKLRARRMRAEKEAQELLNQGEPIPEELVERIKSLDGTVPTPESAT
jgi:NADH-quinone oxidoreductase subunit I